MQNWDLKGKAGGHKEIWDLDIGHTDVHKYGGNHFCIHDFYLQRYAENCKGKCILKYSHKREYLWRWIYMYENLFINK